MSIRAAVLTAVDAAKLALQDLAVDAVLVSRGEAVKSPGVPPSHSEIQYIVKIVITSYKEKEIDGDRIRVSDVQGLMFPEAGVPVPKTNDIVRIGTIDRRVIHNNKVMAGDAVAMSHLQLRQV